MEIIKYANRKYYNKTIHKYVNLSEVAEYINKGVEFTILNHKTKADITKQTKFAALSKKENNV